MEGYGIDRADHSLPTTPKAMPRVHVATIGARRHYAIPRVFQRAGLLGRFYTDIYAGDGSWIRRLASALPPSLRPKVVERFLARFDGELDGDRVVSFPGFGLWYSWQRCRVRGSAAMRSLHAAAARRFNRRVVRTGLRDADVVISHNGAALELFEFARRNGTRCVLDQTLAPRLVERVLLAEELRRWPGWQPELGFGDSEDVLEQREQAEWRLADLILAPSGFVTEGLRRAGIPESKIRVVPYAVSLDRFPPWERADPPVWSRLHVLFVGEIGLRKGVPYLLEALRLLNSRHIHAKLAGTVALCQERVRSYANVAEFQGTVPRSRIGELYRWADVLVLPSICEGSALVTYEALASGVPVVVTPNTGAYVRDGVDGIVVRARDAEAVAGALEGFVRNRGLLRAYRDAAVSGRQRLGLEAYQQRLVDAVLSAADNSAHGTARLAL